MSKASGFTLIEIMVVIVIIGIMATFVVPNLQKLSPRYEREAFIGAMQSIVQLAWQNAIMTGRVHRVIFDFAKGKIRAEKAVDAKISKDQKFQPLKVTYVKTGIDIPKSIVIKQFIIEGFDELARFEGRKTDESWFYIMPDGTTQSVTINLLDTKDTRGGKPRQVGLVLNPFSAQFKQYEKFA
jgi:type II secretion system protein H